MVRLIAHYLENKPDNTLLDDIKAQCIRVRNGKDKNSPEVTSITEEEISKTLSETASIRRIVLDETSERRSLESSVLHVFKSRYKASIMASENRIRSGIKKE